MTSMAILTDVTRCIGCEECVMACQRTHDTGTNAPWRWQGGAEALSSNRWTTIVRAPEDRFVRVHCRHCLEPACASACPVGALYRTPEGPVAYRADICMGCRYCMIACPFMMTRYEWSSPTPRVRKCILCYDQVRSGELAQPACTAACPTKATVFGEREALIAEARARIRTSPGKYIDRIWGEKEVGGTSVLYISDVDLSTAGWPNGLRMASYPALTAPALSTVPWTFAGVGAAALGLSWIIERRKKVAATEAPPAPAGTDGGEL